VTEGNVNSIEDKQIIIVSGMELVPGSSVALPADPAGPAVDPAPEAAPPHTSADAKTPAVTFKSSAGAVAETPATGPTPPSAGHGSKPASRAIQPISTLNPYMHGWSIRAKVVSKGPKRSFNRAGQPSSVFSAELVDEQGTSIEGTFWREAADRFHDSLTEGKVYVFARGSVKPANKKYSSTRNDYCINFDAAAEIESCGTHCTSPCSCTCIRIHLIHGSLPFAPFAFSYEF